MNTVAKCLICGRDSVRIYPYILVKATKDFDFRTRTMVETKEVTIQVCGTDMNLLNRVKKEVDNIMLDKPKELVESAKEYRKHNPIKKYVGEL